MKKKNKFIALILSAVMLAAGIPAMAFAVEAPAPVNVNLSAELGYKYRVMPQDVEIDPTLSDVYGYVDKVKDGPSVLDALIQAHIMYFGDEFSKEQKDIFLVIDENGLITSSFQIANVVQFTVNGFRPNDGIINESGEYTAYPVNQVKLNAGDKVHFFFYEDYTDNRDIYTSFFQNGKKVQEIHVAPGEEFELCLKGYKFADEGLSPEFKWEPLEGVPVCTVITEGRRKHQWKPIDGAITSEGRVSENDGAKAGGGEVTLKFNEKGTYYLKVKSDPAKSLYISSQDCKVVVEDPAPPVTPDTDKPVPADPADKPDGKVPAGPADKPDGKAPVADKTDAPKTGDTNNFMAYGLVALLAGATLTAAYRRKENR